MNISILLNQLITLFLLMGLGFFLYRIHMMPREFNKQATRLLLNVTMPALILNSVLTTEEKAPGKTVFLVLLIAIAMYLVLPLFGFLIAKLLFVSKKQLGLYIFMTVFSNTGFMGFPLINALLGKEAVFYTALFNIIFNLSAYSYGILLVNHGSDRSVKLNLRLLMSPGILLSLLAVVLYFVPVPLHVSVTDAIDYVGSLTTPLAMLLIGASLGSMNLKEVFSDWRVYPYTILKQFFLPLALYPLLSLLIHNRLLLHVTLIMLSVPVANTAVLFATEYDADEKLAARTVFLTTLSSLISIPVILMLCSL